MICMGSPLIEFVLVVQSIIEYILLHDARRVPIGRKWVHAAIALADNPADPSIYWRDASAPIGKQRHTVQSASNRPWDSSRM